MEVDYSGYLLNGTEFDSSLNPGRFPFLFTLGAGQVIAGWDQGLVGMQVGESRTLIISSALAYGANGTSSIPANSVLLFNVTLDAILPPDIVLTSSQGEIIPNGATTPKPGYGTYFGENDIQNGAMAAPVSQFTLNQVGIALGQPQRNQRRRGSQRA